MPRVVKSARCRLNAHSFNARNTVSLVQPALDVPSIQESNLFLSQMGLDIVFHFEKEHPESIEYMRLLKICELLWNEFPIFAEKIRQAKIEEGVECSKEVIKDIPAEWRNQGLVSDNVESDIHLVSRWRRGLC